MIKYMHKILQNFRINAQALGDPNIDHCVESTFFDGKLARFLMLTFLKLSFYTNCILK